MKEKLIKILLLNGGRYFRLCSATRGNDGSIYIYFPINSELKRRGFNQVIPLKYSYHPTGKKCRITGGNENERGLEFKPKLLPPLSEINKPVGLCKMSFFDLKNSIGTFLDTPGGSDYKNTVTISDKDYSNLTIKFFLCAKNYAIPPKKDYKEIHIFPLGDVKIVVTFQDLWGK